jgi:hypothetical protein
MFLNHALAVACANPPSVNGNVVSRPVLTGLHHICERAA